MTILTVGNTRQLEVQIVGHFRKIKSLISNLPISQGNTVIVNRIPQIPEPGFTVSLIKYLLQALFTIVYSAAILALAVSPFATYYFVLGKSLLHSIFGDMMLHVVHYAMIINLIGTVFKISTGFSGFGPHRSNYLNLLVLRNTNKKLFQA